MAKPPIGRQKKLLGGELQEPFFLGAGIFQPHLPNYAPQKYFDRFPLEEIKLPEGFRENDLDDVPAAHAKMAHNPWLKRIRETGQWKPAIQAYLACTAMVDDLVGQIVEALEKSKYADNTIIVLWSDHGFQLGEKGRWSEILPLGKSHSGQSGVGGARRDQAGIDQSPQAGELAGHLSDPRLLDRNASPRKDSWKETTSRY